MPADRLALTPRQRVVLDGYLAGERTEQIAARLGCHRNAITLLMRRAQRRNHRPTRYTLVAAYAVERAQERSTT